LPKLQLSVRFRAGASFFPDFSILYSISNLIPHLIPYCVFIANQGQLQQKLERSFLGMNLENRLGKSTEIYEKQRKQKFKKRPCFNLGNHCSIHLSYGTNAKNKRLHQLRWHPEIDV
jgi:hypothetical protein